MTDQTAYMIPSKGRSEKITTSALLQQAGIAFSVLVEPDEAEAYRAVFDPKQVVILGENNAGIAYARNQAIRIAREQGAKWLWLLDDDIKKFHTYDPIEKKLFPATASILKVVQHRAIDIPNLAVSSLQYHHSAWREWVITENRHCEVAVLLNLSILKKENDEKLKLKVDRDFIIRVLQDGQQTRRFNWLCFECPQIGKMAGGLQEEYKTDNYIRNLNMFIKKHRGFVTKVFKRNGMIDAKINWELVQAIAA